MKNQIRKITEEVKRLESEEIGLITGGEFLKLVRPTYRLWCREVSRIV